MSAAPILEGPPLLAGRYALLGSVGVGGMATVYRGHDHKIDRPVAIKVMRPELQGDERIMRRFRNESRVMARLDHPRVARLIDIGETPAGLPFMIQEWIEGCDLGRILVEGPMPLPRIARLTGQLAEALAACHAAGVVHGDLKPENILVLRAGTPDESIKLVDFGLAQLCRAPLLRLVPGPDEQQLEVAGTPEYMAPELICGAPPAPAADLYAFGILLYELLTGEPPFTEESSLDILLRHLDEVPTAPSLRCPQRALTAAMDALVLSTLSKQAAERPGSAHELAARLSQALVSAEGELDLEVEMELEVDVELDFEPGVEAAPAPEASLPLPLPLPVSVSVSVSVSPTLPSLPPLPHNATMQALLDQGLVKPDDLDDAIRATEGTGIRWQEQLVLLGHLDEVAYCRCLSRKLLVPECDPRLLARVTDEALAELPTEIIVEHRVLPLFVDGDGDLHVAMVDPVDAPRWEEIQFFAGTQRRVLREIIGPTALAWALHRYCDAPTALWPPAQHKPRALVVDDSAHAVAAAAR